MYKTYFQFGNIYRLDLAIRRRFKISFVLDLVDRHVKYLILHVVFELTWSIFWDINFKPCAENYLNPDLLSVYILLDQGATSLKLSQHKTNHRLLFQLQFHINTYVFWMSYRQCINNGLVNQSIIDCLSDCLIIAGFN